MACTMKHTKPFLAGKACTTPRCPVPSRAFSRRTPAVMAAANKPIVVNSSPSEELLASEGVKDWITWSCGQGLPADFSLQFPWHWTADEKAYVLEGEFYVIPNEGEPGAGQPVCVKAGDFAYFPGGMKGTFDVKKPVRKHLIGGGLSGDGSW
ncbi:hypothetical protein DUNSADRAFT_4099 [Dunaliella salina]|uniref:(S)-ureidoglycine aminohydrolase cupin domain-containing protein n=1 Tax=Dunaliella salina TaxID=3046 RepID=A0ABQ7FV00_DUNSA|nr:hypothetical protein DUNSADRAFT_4099 [Dunaliella salina]|eukprot:KAF5826222.1 hypothetical protein DUNSADRAFT_4099 [Dunaliella salina]